MTKISPSFRVNFLVRLASKPLFYWVVPSNCSENSLVLIVRIFGLWASFLAPDSVLVFLFAGPSWWAEKGSIEKSNPQSIARYFQSRRPRSNVSIPGLSGFGSCKGVLHFKGREDLSGPTLRPPPYRAVGYSYIPIASTFFSVSQGIALYPPPPLGGIAKLC